MNIDMSVAGLVFFLLSPLIIVGGVILLAKRDRKKRDE